MTIDTERAQQEKIEPPSEPASLVRAELPRWAPYGIFVGSLVVVGALLAVSGGFSVGLFVFLSAILFGLVTYLVSRSVEGVAKPPTGS